MDRRLLFVAMFIAASLAIALGLLIAGRSNAKPHLSITSIQYHTQSFGEEQQLIFYGSVANIGKAPAHEVVVTVSWLEFDGTEYTDSVNIGTVNEGSSKPFEIVFSADHMITVKWYTQWIEHSGT